MAEFSKSDRADEVDAVKLSELVHGRHFKGRFVFSLSLCLCILFFIVVAEVLMLLLFFKLIFFFFLQWCSLGQPYLLFSSYLASTLYSFSLRLFLKVLECLQIVETYVLE